MGSGEEHKIVHLKHIFLFQICCGFVTMYKYQQIEEKWTLRLTKRIKHMETVEDIILGQPLLIWSSYTYNSALGQTPALWVCLVIEELRCEIKHVYGFFVNGYCKLFPRHKFSFRTFKSMGRSIFLKLSKLLNKFRP